MRQSRTMMCGITDSEWDQLNSNFLSFFSSSFFWVCVCLLDDMAFKLLQKCLLPRVGLKKLLSCHASINTCTVWYAFGKRSWNIKAALDGCKKQSSPVFFVLVTGINFWWMHARKKTRLMGFKPAPISIESQEEKKSNEINLTGLSWFTDARTSAKRFILQVIWDRMALDGQKSILGVFFLLLSVGLLKSSNFWRMRKEAAGNKISLINILINSHS